MTDAIVTMLVGYRPATSWSSEANTAGGRSPSPARLRWDAPRSGCASDQSSPTRRRDWSPSDP